MSKIKIIFICLLIPFFILVIFTFLRIRDKEILKDKRILAKEIHKVLGVLMFDLSQAREATIMDAPADGEWHHRIAFDRKKLGSIEYLIKEGDLFRVSNGKQGLVAAHIADLRLRRQKATSNILEVQIEAEDHVSLISNLKIRINQ